MLIIPNHSIIFNIHSHYSHFLFLFYSHTPTPQLVIPTSLVPIPDFKTYQLLAITWMAPTSPPRIFPDSVKAPKRPYLMVKFPYQQGQNSHQQPYLLHLLVLSVGPTPYFLHGLTIVTKQFNPITRSYETPHGPNGMWKFPTSTMISFKGCLILTWGRVYPSFH